MVNFSEDVRISEFLYSQYLYEPFTGLLNEVKIQFINSYGGEGSIRQIGNVQTVFSGQLRLTIRRITISLNCSIDLGFHYIIFIKFGDLDSSDHQNMVEHYHLPQKWI